MLDHILKETKSAIWLFIRDLLSNNTIYFSACNPENRQNYFYRMLSWKCQLRESSSVTWLFDFVSVCPSVIFNAVFPRLFISDNFILFPSIH